MSPNEISRDSLTGRLILLVDDAKDNLDIMQEYLEMNGAEVMTARNGHEGMELAIHGPDIIITDLAMPVMSGYEFLMALKDNRAMAQIPAIALTGHALDSYRKGAFEAGCHNFLVKPVKLSDLVREILDVLGDTENSSIFPLP